MDRHSSYIFIWLQLELCAMAVLLTRGEAAMRCLAPEEPERTRGLREPGACGEALRGKRDV